MSPPASFNYLVCATPRSGSSVLCDALTATGAAGEPHEYFHDSMLERCCALWGVAPPADLTGHLRLLGQHTRTANGVFGAKVMYPKLVSLLEQMPPDPVRSPARVFGEDLLPGLRYLRVVRRDVLREAVSHLRARQTDHWSSEHGQQPLKAEPRYNFAAIDRLVNHAHRQRANWDAFFTGEGILPVTAYYEDFIADQENVVRRLLDELGIAAPTPLFRRELILRRQGDSLNEEWAERYLADKQRPQAGTI